MEGKINMPKIDEEKAKGLPVWEIIPDRRES